MVNLMSEIKRNNVSSIQIQNFRGISKEKKIKFSKNNRFVILRGENGTGKSSFVNAFEFLFKDDLSAIDFQTKNKRDAFIHKGSKGKDLSIKLNFSDQSYFERTLNDFIQSNKGVSKLYREHESFLSNASFILNRKKLLNFINVKDGERFNAISVLCGLDELESYKNEIKKVKNSFNKLFKDKEKDSVSLIDNINRLLNTDVSCFEDFIDEVNKELKTLDYDLINVDNDLEEYLSTLDFSESYKIKDNINKFNEIYDIISFNQLNIKFENILKSYEKISNDSLISLQYSYKVLDSANEYLKFTKSNVCPICDNEIINEDIVLKINSQLNDVNENISDLNSWKKDINKFILDMDALKLQFNEINKITEELSINSSFNDSKINEIRSQLKDFSEFKYSIIDLRENYDLSGYENKLNDIKTLVNEHDINFVEDESYQKIKNLRMVINELNQLKKIERDLEKISLKRELSLKIYDSFIETKEEHLNQIINNIQADVQKYYNMLHKEDSINSPKLNVKSDNSIKLFLDSFGEESDPRKYSSEGHLDSLGLCIFLAFMKEYNPLDLIVLDDIITTVDFSHKYAIANLLVEEFNEFKILITTHNGLWAQQLGRIITNNGYNYDEINIIRWDLISGPVIRQNKGHVKLIDKYLKEGEYSAAVNTARQYLEYATLTFCRNNTVSIKLQSEYTLYPLYQATRPASLVKACEVDKKNLKNVDDYENIELLYNKLEYLWDELDKNYFIVNNLSHYNDDSFFIHSGEAKRLCELVKEICPILLRFRESRKH